MRELFHNATWVRAQTVREALAEKANPRVGHAFGFRADDAQVPAHSTLKPKGVVPMPVVDGRRVDRGGRPAFTPSTLPA